MAAIVDLQPAEVHALEHPVDDHHATGMPESIRPELIDRRHTKPSFCTLTGSHTSRTGHPRSGDPSRPSAGGRGPAPGWSTRRTRRRPPRSAPSES